MGALTLNSGTLSSLSELKRIGLNHADSLSNFHYCHWVKLLYLRLYAVDIDGCRIIYNDPDAVGIPYFEDRQQSSVYSCLPSTVNNDTNVHVIGVYEAGSGHSFNYHPTYISNVCLNVNGSLLDKPLILVLTTYEPVHWVLHMPEGVVINKVILVTHQ